MLPLQPLRWRFRRPDLRNHRKMLIIDGERGFLGSQNPIDSSYLKIRRWARNGSTSWSSSPAQWPPPANMVFAVHRHLESDELLPIDKGILGPTMPDTHDTSANIVQLVPSGPGYTTEPNLRMFNSIIHHAKNAW